MMRLKDVSWEVVLLSKRSDFEVTSIRFENDTTSMQFEVSKWVEVKSWCHQKRPEMEGEHVKRNNLCSGDQIVYAIGMRTLPLFYCNAATTCIYNGCNIFQTKWHYLPVNFMIYLTSWSLKGRICLHQTSSSPTPALINYNICND